ncbi:hypothetical protein N7492_007391 [Penicillium capsulatum]|uniref:Uncharacterized protein n=1 Tax=Penicillium capsulatum TaxID=69766 RepID=A0A9W9HZP7_9EURO|nr:hypothetical protein N7492_007391 [Penicillium capsulatum]KAJ6117231.1 hypothetical protein N7512_006956 [Penicillium capsulatum]
MPVFNSTLAKRRRFQPPITTFFSTASDTPSTDTYATSHNHYAATTFTAHPVVPAKVQSSLMSVGMRVRKSVADGYKTQAELQKEKALSSVVMMDTTPDRGYAELASFSGVPRPAQGPFTSNHVITDDGDAFSLPSSSQESTASMSVPKPANGQKRTLDDDIYADVETVDDEVGDNWGEASPERTILSPSLGQQRRRIIAPIHKSCLSAAATMDVDDFEEPSFLRRREEVDADYVRMEYA